MFCFLSLTYAQGADISELSEDEIIQLIQNTPESESILIATVNAYDATIIKSDENNITVSFLLSNREGVQPDVRYGVSLLKLTEAGEPSYIAATFPNETPIALGENENIPITYSFDIPPYLEEGKYSVEIEVSNASGVGLAFARAGIVKLGGGEGVVFDGSTCSLMIEGETPLTVYAIDQGVDVSSNETLVLSCQVVNQGEREMTVSPEFVSYRRNRTTGEQVEVSQNIQNTYSVSPKERKTIDIVLPKGVKPQAYDVVVTLHEGDFQVSNEVIVHYVIQGESGTIQNVLLDKDWYRAGDIANIVVTFTRSADSFPDARSGGQGTLYEEVAIEAIITDKDGILCATPAKKVLGENDIAQTNVSLSITHECIKPHVTIKLANNVTGVLLDEMSADLGSEYVPLPQTTLEENNAFKSIWFIILGLSLTTLLIAGVLKLIESKKNIPTIMALFMVCMLYGAGISETKADTILTNGGGAWSINITYNINKSTYTVGDTMVASAVGRYAGCTNNYWAKLYVDVSPNRVVPMPAGYRAGYGLLEKEKSLLVALRDLTYVSPVHAGSVAYYNYSNTRNFTVASTWDSISPKARFRFWYQIFHGGAYEGGPQIYYRNIPYTITIPKCAAEANRNGCTLPETNYGSSAGSCASGYVGSCNYTCTNGTWTENSNSCNAKPNLVSYGFTVGQAPSYNGPFFVGIAQQMSGNAQNIGATATGVSFYDNFTYRYGTTGAWNTWPGSTIGHPSLAPGSITPTPDYTNAFTPTEPRNDLYLQHCVDTTNVIDEGVNEAGNCVVKGPFIVQASPCTAQIINGCVLPVTGGGNSAGACTSGYAGNCNYSCINGTWNENSNSCSAPIISEFKICNVGEAGCVTGGVKSSVISSTNEIYWSSANADFCTAVSGNGFATGNAITGMNTFMVDATAGTLRTYTLGCGNGGVLGITRSIDVLSILAIPTITTSERVVEEGGTVTLNWDTKGGDPASCSITGGSLNLSSLGTQTGQIDVTVNARTTYTITCGPNSGKVTVEVIPRGFES